MFDCYFRYQNTIKAYALHTTDVLYVTHRCWTCLQLIGMLVAGADQGAGCAQSGRVGHARQAALSGHTDPRVGHCLLRPSAHRRRGGSQVYDRL